MRCSELIQRAEAARATTDPQTASALALELALAAVTAGRKAGQMEVERKDCLRGIRDRIMQERGMAKTPAEEEARKDAAYKEYCETMAHHEDTRDRARAWAQYFERQARLLAATMEVASV